MDIQNFTSYGSMSDMIAQMTKEIVFDIKQEYPNCTLFQESSLLRTMKDVFSQTKQKFIFIIDEWDCIFRIYKNDKTAQKDYLDFLRDLFKNQPYVALVYMTGILPIKKYGEHSALNMFDEYSMSNQFDLAEFTGFTEAEVADLCAERNLSLDEVKNGTMATTLMAYPPTIRALLYLL